MESHRKVILFSIIITIIIFSLIIYFLFIPKKTDQKQASLLSEKKSIKTEQKEPAGKKMEKEISEPIISDIKLNNSDEALRELLQNYSSHPTFKTWLGNEELIRKFVVVTDNIANGESPSSHLNFLRPKKEFTILEKKGKIMIRPSSYQRYNLPTEVLVSINSGGILSTYRQLKPLLNEAYKELGHPEEDFEAALLQAFQVLLKTPIVLGRIYLEKKVISYAFTDQYLENLNAAQKHFLRMGPANVEKIQNKVLEIISTLGFKKEQFPQPKKYIPQQ